MKNLTSWAALLLAAMTLNSCSQDAELEAAQETAATTGALTPEQKAQIMELAKYYDITFEFDETPSVRSLSSFNMDSVEAICKKIVALRGTFTSDLDKSKRTTIILPQQNSISVPRLTRSSMEANHAEIEVGVSDGYWIAIVIDCYNGSSPSVSAYETATARPLTVETISGGLMANGDFSGYYRILLNYPAVSGKYSLTLSLEIHNGQIRGTAF